MRVIYRMCGIPSTNPSPIFNDDKDTLNLICLKSFVNAFPDIELYITFLCDHCDLSYTDMIKKVVPSCWKWEVLHTRIGINETMLMSYEIAKSANCTILFQECDYIYRPNSGIDLINGVENLGLVSPYDHKNFYIDKSIHSDRVTLKLVDDVHWRSTERNTMTFAITYDKFMLGYDIFTKYGYLDNDVWLENRKLGTQMYVPLPSVATHMAKDWLAPSVDWQKIWTTLTN